MRIDFCEGLTRSLGLAFGFAVGLASLLSFATPASASIVGTRTSAFAYDAASGLVTEEVEEPGTPSLAVTTDYTYDAYGNKLTATVSGSDIATRASSTTYDAKGEFATGAANALGQSESWTYDPKFSLPLSHTGPNGLTTTWAYDSFGRKTLETRPDGTKTSFTYVYCTGVNGGTASCPTYGAYVATATPLAADGTTQNGPLTQTYYDGLGRAIATDVQGFDGSVIRTASQYDAQGHVLKVSRPYFLAGGAPRWLTNAYDALGRIVTATFADGSHTTYSYNGLTGSVTNDKGQTKTTVKNARGLIVSATDANGKTTTYAYDAFDNLIATTDSAGNVSTATYDVKGRKIAMSDPDMGSWSYSYDVLGELVSQTDAKGQVTTLSYDKLGRVIQRIEPGLTSTWVYDTAPMGVGQLAIASTDHGYSRSFFYDGQGRPSQTSTTILGDSETISTYYDANGRVNMVAYPSGFTVQYDYTGLGYLSDLKDANSTQVYWTANVYDAEMNLTQATAGNGVVTNQTFDPNRGFLTGVQAGPSNNIANFAYGFDTLGNLTSRSDATQSLTESFQYDALNRVTQYAITGGATKTVTYDDLGNIASKSDVGTYSYNASGPSSIRPHAVAGITPSGTGTVNTSFTYDANGNMTSGEGRTVTWTSFDKVASIAQGTTTVSFDYDSDHARMRQVASAGTTLYFGDAGAGVTVEKFTGTSGNVQWNEYLTAAGKMIGEHFTNISSGVTTTATRYFITDHLGSTAVITDETGAVTERLSYDAWGKRRFPTGADDPTGSITSQTTRGFTGQEHIPDVGLINYNGRIYDPVIGRFMSADPFVEDPTNSQDLNRYAYVHNNPLSYTDPSGYFLGLIGDYVTLLFRLVTNPVILAAITAIVAPYLLPATFASYSAPTQFAIIGVEGAVAGYAATGTFKGAAIGAATALAFRGVGWFKGEVGIEPDATLESNPVAAMESAGLHAVVGGASSALNGQGFRSGFFAAGIADLANYNFTTTNAQGQTVPNYEANLIEHTVAGGVGAVLGGGKFANGAVTGAFGYLFNSLAHSYRYQEQVCSNSDAACSTANAWDALKHNAYPGQDPSTTVENNGRYYVMDSPQWGAIRTVVDEASMTITNITLDTHVFCCGSVSLHIFGGDDGVYLSIVGAGSNSNLFTWGFNYGASLVFPTWQTNRITYTMDSSYFGRTGSWPMGSSFAPPGTATARPPGPPW